MKSKEVGRSSRTPVKHDLLNGILGKVVGALGSGRRLPCHARPFVCVDMCGGDGLSTDEHDASPQIIHRHCNWLRNRRGCDANATVIELQANTFDALHANTSQLSGFGDWFRIYNTDARSFVMPALEPKQAAFVHCDPNTVDQIPLTRPFVASWNRYTMYLVTLGCNVGGLKMLPLSKRAVWFDYVGALTACLPRHHDAILFWLNGDSSQWAYLLSLPAKWSEDFGAAVVRRGSVKWPGGIGRASLLRETAAFNDAVNRLFLTRKEYHAGTDR